MHKQLPSDAGLSPKERQQRRSAPGPRDRRIAHLSGQQDSGSIANRRVNNCLDPIIVVPGMAGTIMYREQLLDSLENAIFRGVDSNMANIGTRHQRGGVR